MLGMIFDVIYMVLVVFTVNKISVTGRKPSFWDYAIVFLAAFNGGSDGILFFKHMNTDVLLAGIYSVLCAANLVIAVWGYSVFKRIKMEM